MGTHDYILIPDGKHADLSASGAYRWSPCPGSVRESKGQPDRTTRYAAEGTVAHEIAANILVDKRKLTSHLGLRYRAGAYDFEVDHDMLDAVKVYVDYVREILRENPDAIMSVEADLTRYLAQVHPKFGGMADCIIFSRKKQKLWVIDYKHGAGVFVNAVENTQLKYYGLGALLKFSGEPVKHVEVVIAQPRCDYAEDLVRSFEFPAFDLLEFETDLLDAAKRTEDPDAELSPGDWCKFCRAADKPCPALKAQQDALMSAEFDDLDSKEVGPALTPEKVGMALQLIPQLKARISRLQEIGYEMALKGDTPTGQKLVQKRGTRKWTDEEEARNRLRGTVGVMSEPKLKSPAQVEKVLGKAGYRDKVEDLVEIKSSGYTLVPETDKRPQANALTVDDFEDVSNEEVK